MSSLTVKQRKAFDSAMLSLHALAAARIGDYRIQDWVTDALMLRTAGGDQITSSEVADMVVRALRVDNGVYVVTPDVRACIDKFIEIEVSILMMM